jgi:hypothetical protein
MSNNNNYIQKIHNDKNYNYRNKDNSNNNNNNNNNNSNSNNNNSLEMHEEQMRKFMKNNPSTSVLYNKGGLNNINKKH